MVFAMKKQYLEAGKIVATQGIKGEVRVQSFCDTADFLLDFDFFYIKEKSGEYTKLTIEYSRVQKNVVVMKIDGINTVEDAQKLRTTMLYIDREDVELEKNCYFIQDLIGLTVLDDADRTMCYGTIVDVTQTGANDVYHIKGDDEIVHLIPAIAKIVKTTSLENGTMTISPIGGMFDGED